MLVKQAGGVLVSSKVVTGRSGPRIRIERETAFGSVPARQIQYWIPAESKTAIVTYTFARSDDGRYLRIVGEHASRVVPDSVRAPVGERATAQSEHDNPQLLLHRGAQTGDIGMMRRALAAGADANEETFLNTPLAVAATRRRVVMRSPFPGVAVRCGSVPSAKAPQNLVTASTRKGAHVR